MAMLTDSLVDGMNKEECQALPTEASLPEVAKDVCQPFSEISLKETGA